MALLPVGARIYNRGDVCNQPHFGTITHVIVSKWGAIYNIMPDADAERGSYTIPTNNVDTVDKGHCGTRIVTETAYRQLRAEKIAAYRAATPEPVAAIAAADFWELA